MPGIALNEDFENFFASFPAEKMNEGGLREQIDRYASSQVTDLLFNGNAMRTVFDSESTEPIWAGLEEGADGKHYFRGKEVKNTPLPTLDTALNSRLLNRNVKNPFQKRIDYGRARGLKVWMSMRMNDVHWVSDNDFLMHSEFWRENPQLRRAPWQGSWGGKALDYGRPEVCGHALSLIGEYLSKFDIDGLELDWMRFPYHFKPGHEARGCLTLNELMRKVRLMAQDAGVRRGRPVKIGVRVPARPDDARRMGFDVVSWCRDKLVDRVVATGFLSTDYDIPVELWKCLTPPDIELAAGFDLPAQPYPESSCVYNTAEMIFGHAASFLWRGADKIYFFNHMDGLTGMRDKKAFRRVLENAGDRITVEPQSRRHVVTYTDTRPEGVGRDCLLPLILPPGVWMALRLNVGGGIRGRRAMIILGFPHSDKGADGRFNVRLNGDLCAPVAAAPSLETPDSSGTFFAFDTPQDSMQEGDNVVEVCVEDGRKHELTWCEIFIP